MRIFQDSSEVAYSPKRDVTDLGTVFLQMLYSNEDLNKFSSAREFLGVMRENIDPIVYDFASSFFVRDPHHRPTASELLTSNFLRGATERSISSSAGRNLSNRQDISLAESPTYSRYRMDFEEIGRLGAGGFGTVIKARNKIDGRYYAIKNIVLNPDDNYSRILREVSGLARLQNRHIVRYFGAWIEHSHQDGLSQEETMYAVPSDDDFMSFSDYVTFQKSLKTDETEKSGAAYLSTSESAKHDLPLLRKSGVLFIQMEFCENRTLKDIVFQKLGMKEVWRYFHQIVEAITHIHSQGLIHRDLKPANIFIDHINEIKVGDFGLSTENTILVEHELSAVPRIARDELTTDIGTLLYV